MEGYGNGSRTQRTGIWGKMGNLIQLYKVSKGLEEVDLWDDHIHTKLPRKPVGIAM